MNNRIAVVGHSCFDLHSEVERIPGPGELEVAIHMGFSLGGPVCNTGFALAMLGQQVTLATCRGSDALGAALEERFSCEARKYPKGQVDIQCLELGNTSGSIVLAYPDNRAFIHFPGSNDLITSEDIHPDMGDLSIMHFGYPALLPKMTANAGAETVELFTHAKDNGVVTSLDHVMYGKSSWAATYDWRTYHKNVLPLTDIFCPSIEELAMMLFPADYKAIQDHEFVTAINPFALAEISEELFDLGAKILLIKLGKFGLYLRTGGLDPDSTVASLIDVRSWSNRELYIPAIAVENPKTTGAGDAAIAGFLASANNGLLPWQAVEIAAVVAACCCQNSDATSGIKNWAETIGLLEMPQEPALFKPDIFGYQSMVSGRVLRGPNDVSDE